MAAHIETYYLDLALTGMKSGATDIVVCSAEPTTYAAANATLALGRKVFGAGAVFPTAIAAGGATNSRKLTAAGFTDGTVATAGTGTWYAIIDTVNSRLITTGTLASSLTLTVGQPFALPAFDVQLNGQ